MVEKTSIKKNRTSGINEKKPPKPQAEIAEENQKGQSIKNLLTQWEMRRKIERYVKLSSLGIYVEEPSSGKKPSK